MPIKQINQPREQEKSPGVEAEPTINERLQQRREGFFGQRSSSDASVAALRHPSEPTLSTKTKEGNEEVGESQKDKKKKKKEKERKPERT